MRPLVATAVPVEESTVTAPSSITVLTGRDLSKRRASSLAELLWSVEGIDVGGNAGRTGGLTVSIRGMPSEYTLILVDGRRQNAAGNVAPNGFGETATSFLPPLSAIARVEVIRGPMSTLYGADAMGGVVNIITKRATRRWTGSLSSDVTLQRREGFGNAYSGSGSVSGALVANLVSVALSGSAMHRAASELIPTSRHRNATIERRGPSPVRADNWTVAGRLTATPGVHELSLEADVARQKYDNSEGQLGPLDQPDLEQPAFYGYAPVLGFNRDQATLSHTWRHRSGVLATSLMRNATWSTGRTLPLGVPGGPPGSGAPDRTAGAPRTLRSVSTVLDIRATSSARRHAYTIGGEVRAAEMIDGVALAPFASTQWALFAEDEWRFAKDLALTVGLRRDEHDTFGGKWSPRGYLVWRAAPDWTVKGGVGRGYRAPRAEQLADALTGYTAHGRNATTGTPTLRPETSTAVEIATLYSNAAGVSAGLTLFHNRFRDRIAKGVPIPNCTFVLAPDLPGCVNYGDFPMQEEFRQSVNVDRAMTRGGEATMKAPLGERVSLSGNYTFTHSEQQSGENAGLPLYNTPRHAINADARAEFSRRVSTWLRSEYRSERARRTTTRRNLAWEALGDYRAYSLVHVGAGYRVGRGIRLDATVFNALDHDFLEYAPYPVRRTAANPSGVLYTNLYNNPHEGRRLWLSTTLQF
ncbi:MAG TPA: TonB-dependent receptor [Longimicrobiales bacterium]|nr:TonB-dependent receptor [Longimicrobiales bacterium]